MRIIPRIAVAMLSLALTSLTFVGLAGPAQAADYYRYWAYYHVTDGEYVASQEGVGVPVPEEGAVEAFRYAASADPDNPNLPRVDLAEATFDAICEGTEAADGEKRVGVIVDFGVEADAEGQAIPDPMAACAAVPADATALQVLQAAVGDVRTKTSSFGPLLCGITGYPAEGCADVVTTTATPADDGYVDVALASEQTDQTDQTEAADTADDDDTWLYVGLGALVLALVAAGLIVSRRNRSNG